MLDQSFFFTSEFPQEVLHPLVANKVSSANHGDGHQHAEDEQGQAPNRSSKASARPLVAWLVFACIGPNSVSAEHGNKDHAEGQASPYGWRGRGPSFEVLLKDLPASEHDTEQHHQPDARQVDEDLNGGQEFCTREE